MAQHRKLVEGWPTLMSAEMAARYLSLEAAAFDKVAARFGVFPAEIEPDILRWRKSDLDQLVKRLEVAPNHFADNHRSRALRLDDNEIQRVADALATRLGATQSTKRELVSIKDACLILGIARTTIYRLINEDKLSTRQIGRRTLIPMTEIQKILNG